MSAERGNVFLGSGLGEEALRKETMASKESSVGQRHEGVLGSEVDIGPVATWTHKRLLQHFPL